MLKNKKKFYTHRRRPFDKILKPCVAELKADNIVKFLSFRRRRLIISAPLGHWHLNSLLCVDIHNVYNASTACKIIDRKINKWGEVFPSEFWLAMWEE